MSYMSIGYVYILVLISPISTYHRDESMVLLSGTYIFTR